MKVVLQTFFILLFTVQAYAQKEYAVSGIITDESGLPLPGVNIVAKGSTTGTQTNFDGEYAISVTPGAILSYSFIGYVIEERKIRKSTTISFAMQPDVNAIDEVVVTALGTKRRKDRITTVSQEVRYEQLSQANNPSVVNSLSGKVSGLTIQNQKTTRIVLRGNRSLPNQGKKALIVIDGVVSSEQELSAINPNKINEVNVIKGAQGSALYGSQGANGVIVVQTKNAIIKQPEALSNEAYTKFHENKFKSTILSPLSTFSIDVDKASYSNVRRLINNGQEIPASAVKIEEMVNYFDYVYPQPQNEDPFSINVEQVITPWNKDTRLVKIGLQGKTYENEAIPASNLTFLIDVSGSMNSANKLPLLKSAFTLLVNQLRDKDRVSIVVYAGAAGVVLEPTSGKHKDKILKALNNLSAGGSTAGGEGIELAYKLAAKNFNKNGNNRVILATDGDFNVGASSNSDMEDLIVQKRKSGVFLSVLGFGMGNYKDDKLELLANKGNGNHAYIDSMQEAKLIFGKEFGGTLYTIAKDVKIQLEFNPSKVRGYRLIGYENRLLEDEDFVNDAIDAGELGSGHSVTALYEVIPVGVESAYLDPSSELKYTKNTVRENTSDDLLTVKFRYKKPDGDKSIEMVHVAPDAIVSASEDMRFAAAVALFGMQLRASQFYNKTTSKDVVALAKSGRGLDKAGYRAEFIRLVEAVDL
ncbi:VWA domain-containing protein [Bizionia paragorgiae]|uniref:Ca-activated chloride channel family protein n=1 Tax=Bizionia paragorgiae TaxID=283786 RepID=A0A1H3X9V1_BIZPA|nr:VWA domain-containing protein [Bizionia paragorgiae]SDZ95444.1 Ca-activated chloride channel family protein [Bizionia paragorgiae]